MMSEEFIASFPSLKSFAQSGVMARDPGPGGGFGPEGVY